MKNNQNLPKRKIIEQFYNYDGGEKYKDVIKDLPKIDRVFVISYGVNKGYSFLEEEVEPFYNTLEDILQLEARKLDYHEWYELDSVEMEKKHIAFYERDQKENGVIYETNTFDIYIYDNKYIGIGSNTFEVVDQESLKTLLDEIERVSNVNL